MKDKLNKDSRDYKLCVPVKDESNKNQPVVSAPQGKNTKPPVLHVAKYQQDIEHYDEILSAIGEYFELFRNHTDLLEDMWLQILHHLKFQPPTMNTEFRKVHYLQYNKIVIQNEQLRTLIDEGADALQK